MNREQRRCKHPPKMQVHTSTDGLVKTEWWACRKCGYQYKRGGFGELMRKAAESGLE